MMRSPSCSINMSGMLTGVPCVGMAQVDVPKWSLHSWAQSWGPGLNRTAHHHTEQYYTVIGVGIRWKRVVGGSWVICPHPQK
eukprot:8795790-Karenia_brevis.AAC.1